MVQECDCSICVRVLYFSLSVSLLSHSTSKKEQLGRILTYRPSSQISLVLAPYLSLSSYAFATKQFQHKFCSKCGVNDVVDDVIEGLEL